MSTLSKVAYSIPVVATLWLTACGPQRSGPTVTPLPPAVTPTTLPNTPSPKPTTTETATPAPMFTLGPSPMPTIAGAGSLSGKVLWATGEPRSGFEERFIREDNENISYTAFTDINGEYKVTNIPVGKYEIGSYRPSGIGFHTPQYVIVREGTVTEVPTKYILKWDLEITSPTEGESISLPLTVTWNSYPNAMTYRVQVVDYGEGKIVSEETTSDTRLTIDSLRPGDYGVSVSALNSERAISLRMVLFSVK